MGKIFSIIFISIISFNVFAVSAKVEQAASSFEHAVNNYILINGIDPSTIDVKGFEMRLDAAIGVLVGKGYKCNEIPGVLHAVLDKLYGQQGKQIINTDSEIANKANSKINKTMNGYSIAKCEDLME